MTATAAAYPERPDRIWLRDDSAVLIRPLRVTDAAVVADVFGGLGRESRWLRFLSPKDRLTEAEMRYLTDVDGHDHEAVAALASDGRGVGIARYIRQHSDPRAAEISLTVADDWQGRGLGTALFERLSERGREEGLDRFFALVSLRNAVALHLLRRQGADINSVERSGGTVEVELPLGSNGEERRVLASLRALHPRRPDVSEWVRPTALSASAPSDR